MADIFLPPVWKPWLKCPPWGKSKDIILSCGYNNPVKTAIFAGDPERAWTLTPQVPQSLSGKLNALSALSWQSNSNLSVNYVPP